MKWTKEECHKESMKYKTRKEFSNNNHWAYQKSVEKGWINEICQHMKIICHPNNYWTEEKCLEIASKYDDLRTFKEEYEYVYEKIIKNNWKYMIKNMNPVINDNFWTKEKCLMMALKCETKKEFRSASEVAYRWALKKGIMNEICSHMKPLGNRHKRCVYVYIFEDNSVYVGLTYNLDSRMKQHMSSNKFSSVKEYIKESGLTPKIIQLTDYIEKKQATKMESEFLEKYKNDGFKILNRAKTGGCGGDILIWTEEKCKIAALECKTHKEFREKYPTASIKSYTNGWKYKHLDENSRKRSGYWTKEKCLEVALKYETLKDFRENNFNAYSAACHYEFREEICSHLKK